MESSSRIEVMSNEINFIELNFIKTRKKKNQVKCLLKLRFFVFSYLQFLNFNFILPNFVGGKILLLLWIVNTCDLNGLKLSNLVKKNLIFRLIKNKFKNFNYENLINEKLHLPLQFAFFSLICVMKCYKFFIMRHRIYIYFIIKKSSKKIYKNNFDQSEVLEARIIYSYLFVSSILDLFNGLFITNLKKKMLIFFRSSYFFEFKNKTEIHASLEYCLINSQFFSFSFTEKNKLKNQFLNYVNHNQSFFNFGFSGRKNKTVDTCYFFWILAVSVVLDLQFTFFFEKICNFLANLEVYAISDKIGKKPDIYHTYYLNLCLCFEVFAITSKQRFGCSSSIKKILFPKINPIYMLRESTLFFNLL